ncbi:MAG: adenylosuccinate lyase [Oligoflexia bacterium]|nr:adenylosuccinate lyase [Oligoflexia bacterium]
MIERYTLPEMAEIWQPKSRFKYLLEVEKSVALIQGRLGIIPRAAAKKLQSLKKIDIDRIEELERTTKHDVIAFVTSQAEKAGAEGRYLHYGMTSSDVLDTALSLQIRDGGRLLIGEIEKLEKALKVFVRAHKKLLCAGRTHGMHAEPTTLGLKFAGFLAEITRAKQRLSEALTQVCVVKLSGAVGTYSSQPPEVERGVAQLLKLPTEVIATQVVPRDRHAELFLAIALLGSAFERLAVEIRHLQRTEVGELEEGFEKGQKGSSAMPHKRNPIGSENITGISRLLRGYALASLENVALWHERDISHSSVERVIFPDAFIVSHYATHRLKKIIESLRVNKARVKENLDLTRGQIFSSHVLLALVDAGLTREEAYSLVQKHSHQLGAKQTLLQSLLSDSEVKSKVKASELREIFSGKSHLRNVETLLARVLR